MCGRGRYSLKSKVRNVELSGRYVEDASSSISGGFGADLLVVDEVNITVENLSPAMLCPVLVSKSNRINVATMTWGLIPTYVEAVFKPDHFSLFNKRIESLRKHGYFRTIAETKRCVVVLDGFYEWKSVTGSKCKQPFYTCLKEKPLQIAGIFEMSKKLNENGDIICFPTFAILTGEPSEKFAVLHDREPVLLTDKQAMMWLNSNQSLDFILQDLAVNPTDPDLSVNCGLDFYPVTPKMSKAQYQGSDCAEPMLTTSHTADLSSFFNSSNQKGDSAENLLHAVVSSGNCEESISPKKRKLHPTTLESSHNSQKPSSHNGNTDKKKKDKIVQSNTIQFYFQK